MFTDWTNQAFCCCLSLPVSKRKSLTRLNMENLGQFDEDQFSARVLTTGSRKGSRSAGDMARGLMTALKARLQILQGQVKATSKNVNDEHAGFDNPNNPVIPGTFLDVDGMRRTSMWILENIVERLYNCIVIHVSN